MRDESGSSSIRVIKGDLAIDKGWGTPGPRANADVRVVW